MSNYRLAERTKEAEAATADLELRKKAAINRTMQLPPDLLSVRGKLFNIGAIINKNLLPNESYVDILHQEQSIEDQSKPIIKAIKETIPIPLPTANDTIINDLTQDEIIETQKEINRIMLDSTSIHRGRPLINLLDHLADVNQKLLKNDNLFNSLTQADQIKLHSSIVNILSKVKDPARATIKTKDYANIEIVNDMKDKIDKQSLNLGYSEFIKTPAKKRRSGKPPPYEFDDSTPTFKPELVYKPLPKINLPLKQSIEPSYDLHEAELLTFRDPESGTIIDPIPTATATTSRHQNCADIYKHQKKLNKPKLIEPITPQNAKSKTIKPIFTETAEELPSVKTYDQSVRPKTSKIPTSSPKKKPQKTNNT